MPLPAGTTLAHYRISAQLGSGAMGDVYRAQDLRLRRDVALKTLRGNAQFAHARLLAEARAASALTHPHIAVVYEIGEATVDAETVSFIAMEYVEGTTLAALAAAGRLDLDVVLDVFEQIADALAEAARLGVVHRDLKPANVMVTASGRAKVLDFGVAKRPAGRAAAPDDMTRTAELGDADTGFAGTIGYAAPEQLTGRDVDPRADVFSLGVMLYEMIAGHRPFGGDNAAQVLESMLAGDVPPFDDTASDPRLTALEPFVRRLLARKREDRPSSDSLRATIAAIRKGEAAAAGDAAAVVIAEFANISGSPDDDWLGAGIAETLTMDAAQLAAVTVVPRERFSAMLRTLQPAGGPADARLQVRAARSVGARWLVSGAFQRSREAVRVTASLVDVASGDIVRTARVDGRVDAVFELQDHLMRELAGLLRAAIAPSVTPAETGVVSAYEAFSRGLLNREAETFEALDRAVVLFQRAVVLDPDYARAHVELGAALSTKADYLSMPELHASALASLRRATELQPGSARAWRELGSTLLGLGQAADAMQALRRALSVDPADASSIGAMGRALFIGYARFDEAAEWFERAVERNASAGWYWLQLAHCAALLRDFSRGERAAARAMELQESFLSGRQGLFMAGAYMRAGHLAALQGRHREATRLFEREQDFLVRTEHPLRQRIPVELNARLGDAWQRLGDAPRAGAAFDAALVHFERRARLGADDPFTRYYAAAVHALRGDAEPALAYLERALAVQPAFTAARAAIEPEFESLRADARFQRLLQLRAAT